MKCLVSFVNPFVPGWGPADNLLLTEPQGNFLVGRFNGVRSVDDVTSNLNAQISSDGSWGGVGWVGFTEQNAAGFDDVQTFPHHRYDWAAVHVADQRREEGPVGQIGVVLLQQFFGSL